MVSMPGHQNDADDEWHPALGTIPSRRLGRETDLRIQIASKREAQMYGRLVTLQIAPGRMDEFIAKWHSDMIPLASSQPGWSGARLFVNRESGRAVVVGMWATEQDSRASGPPSAHADRQRSLMSEFVNAPAQFEDFEMAGEVNPS
ncbi:MAG: antibiotic biosynthesis monooxygenase family protein [Aeromicrobium sp.]